MKKFLVLAVALFVSTLVMVACQPSTESISGRMNDMTTAEILEAVFESVDSEEFPIARMFVEHDDDVRERYLMYGVQGVPFTEATGAQLAIGWGFLISIVRLEEGANYAQMRTNIYNNLDIDVWVCASAEAKRAVRAGNIVFAIMADTAYVDVFANAFLALV